jgi:hypothetical protein
MIKNIQEIKDKIEDAANSDGRELRKEYSGRCMFGETCWGIVCDDPNNVIAEVGLKGARTDSMGLQTIVYWTQVSGD